MLNHNVCKSDPGVRGTDSHSTFFLVIPLCFYWYHRQDAPTFHQLIGMPYFLSKFLKISPGAGPGLRSWCGLGGPGHWRQQTESAEPARHPLPAGLLWPVPESLGLRGQQQAAMGGTREPFLCLLR